MIFDILTIFPDQVKNFLKEGVFRIAQEKKLVEIKVHNIRDWTDDNHNTVDDTPYGGGAGMVMKIEPLYKAVNDLKRKNTTVIALTPRGEQLNQKLLKSLTQDQERHYILICGHYEGMDERIHNTLVDIDISIGDFILSGGELPALVVVDGMIRLIKGVLGNVDSAEEETFSNNLLEYPQYTRPADFMGHKVPEILLSGDHAKVKKWREDKAKELTREKRPDLVK